MLCHDFTFIHKYLIISLLINIYKKYTHLNSVYLFHSSTKSVEHNQPHNSTKNKKNELFFQKCLVVQKLFIPLQPQTRNNDTKV